MNTELRKSSKILLAGAIAAGLSVPVLGAAAFDGAPSAHAATPDAATTNHNLSGGDLDATRALYNQIYDQLSDGDVNRGDSFKLGDRDATLCMMGNGYGINGLAVGPNTSCEFAGEVFGALIAKADSPRDNARHFTPSTVHAHSPVTGQDYDMKCVTGQDNLITCTGGIGAAVYMF